MWVRENEVRSTTSSMLMKRSATAVTLRYGGRRGICRNRPASDAAINGCAARPFGVLRRPCASAATPWSRTKLLEFRTEHREVGLRRSGKPRHRQDCGRRGGQVAIDVYDPFGEVVDALCAVGLPFPLHE